MYNASKNEWTTRNFDATKCIFFLEDDSFLKNIIISKTKWGKVKN